MGLPFGQKTAQIKNMFARSWPLGFLMTDHDEELDFQETKTHQMSALQMGRFHRQFLEMIDMLEND